MLKNEAQERIINETEGQMIVIACPGSGKTTTILRRIHHMVGDLGIDPTTILMITFTKAAANEMDRRYSELYGGNPGIKFCTIHALCLDLLVKFAGYKYTQVAPHPKDYVFRYIQYNRQIRDKKKFAKEAMNDISVVKNSRARLSDYTPRCCKDKELFRNIYEYYTSHMSDDGQIDYDDILLLAYKLLQDRPDVLGLVRQAYQHIHVDEYQDTNFLQRDIIYLIAGDDGNLAVVGDDDQSIYAFRGARPEVMFSFKEHYPHAKEVKMTTNYRSDTKVIDTAVNLITKNKARFPKEFVASHTEAGEVFYSCYRNRQAEVYGAVQQIKALAQKEGPDSIAVLYRTNAQAADVADMLSGEGIPFYSNERIENRYSSWMFDDLCSYFRMALGTGEKADFSRTVGHPNRWLWNVKFNGGGINGLDEGQMKNDVYDPKKETWKNKKAFNTVDEYLEQLYRIASWERDGRLDLALHEILQYGEYCYQGYIEEYSDAMDQGTDSLYVMWDAFISDIKKNNIKRFSEWERYAMLYRNWMEEQNKKHTGVCLSTMHSAKGLEWNNVFIIDCVDGYCPYKVNGKTNDQEEERRLFYVAATRAENRLFLYSYQMARGKYVKESPYIRESGLLEK